MNDEVEKRLCQALAKWAEGEISRLFPRVCIGPCRQGVEYDTADGERHTELYRIHDIAGATLPEPPPGIFSLRCETPRESPLAAAVALIRSFENPVGHEDLVLVWRRSPMIKRISQIEPLFVAHCRVAILRGATKVHDATELELSDDLPTDGAARLA